MKSSFQTIIIIVFMVVFGVAILIFAGIFTKSSGTSDSTTPQGNVMIWGIFPDTIMQKFVSDFNIQNRGYSLSYQEHKPETFNQDLIVALANQSAPSLVIFSSEIFSAFKDKLYTIPYDAYPQRTYFDTNIEGANVFLSKDGLSAVPLLVDPIVTFYNKDIISGANIVNTPTSWGELQNLVPVLTKKGKSNAITQSAIALGTSQNINNLRDIVSAMFLQTGDPIVYNDISTDSHTVSLGVNEKTAPSIIEALDFYTSFSNPTNKNYSWNSSFNSSLDMFLAGKVAFYIGHASELFNIRAQNPNLNFDVMELFKTNIGIRQYTYGSFVGIGMIKNGPNLTAAYPALNFISAKDSVDGFAKLFSLPPVRKDLLAIPQKDPYVSVFFRSALSAFSWADLNPASTEAFFRAMIKDVTSGRSDATTAVYELSKNLQSNSR